MSAEIDRKAETEEQEAAKRVVLAVETDSEDGLREWVKVLTLPLRVEWVKSKDCDQRSNNTTKQAIDDMHFACAEAIARIARSLLPDEAE